VSGFVRDDMDDTERSLILIIKWAFIQYFFGITVLNISGYSFFNQFCFKHFSAELIDKDGLFLNLLLKEFFRNSISPFLEFTN